MSIMTEFSDATFIQDQILKFINQERTKRKIPSIQVDPALNQFAKQHAKFNLDNTSNSLMSMDGKQSLKTFMKRLNPLCKLSNGIITLSTYATKSSSLISQLRNTESIMSMITQKVPFNIGIGVAASWFPSIESRPEARSRYTFDHLKSKYQLDSRKKAQDLAKKLKINGNTHSSMLTASNKGIAAQKSIISSSDSKLSTLTSQERQAAEKARSTLETFFWSTAGIPHIRKYLQSRYDELKVIEPQIKPGCAWQLKSRKEVLLGYIEGDKRSLATKVAEVNKNRENYVNASNAHLKIMTEQFTVGVQRSAAIDMLAIHEETKLRLGKGNGRRLYGYYDDNIKGFLSSLKQKAYYSQITILLCEKWQ